MMTGPYRPNAGDTLEIEGKTYRFTLHPHAKNMPYGQTGRKATVYQIDLQERPGTFFALKIFLQKHRSPRYAETQDRLRKYASLPGLQVCDNRVLTDEKDHVLLEKYPDLTYAVKMVWVNGKTWEEMVVNTQPISQEQSRQLAIKFLNILRSMEEKHVAHCDLSGPNVLINIDPVDVSLVDVEDLYAPDLKRPDKPPGGSDGYAHLTAPEGLWSEVADRFAGAILLSEMLGWCDEQVRRIAYGQSYFDPKEVQKGGSDRLTVLSKAVEARFGHEVTALLQHAWNSNRLEDCPSFKNWEQVLLEKKTRREERVVLAVGGLEEAQAPSMKRRRIRR
jgi:serine/threonine protein kinase